MIIDITRPILLILLAAFAVNISPYALAYPGKLFIVVSIVVSLIHAHSIVEKGNQHEKK